MKLKEKQHLLCVVTREVQRQAKHHFCLGEELFIADALVQYPVNPLPLKLLRIPHCAFLNTNISISFSLGALHLLGQTSQFTGIKLW